MIAFKIYVNGQPVVTAGQNDWAVLAMHVDALRDKEDLDDYDLRFSVGGLSLESEEKVCHHFRWGAKDLKLGNV